VRLAHALSDANRAAQAISRLPRSPTQHERHGPPSQRVASKSRTAVGITWRQLYAGPAASPNACAPRHLRSSLSLIGRYAS